MKPTSQILIENLPAVLTAFAAVVAAFAGILGVVRSSKNSAKIDKASDKIDNVQTTVNGQSERHETLAQQLGVAQGTAAEKEKQSNL